MTEHERRCLISQLFRVLSWRGAGITAVVFLVAGYAMTALATVGAVGAIAATAISPDSVQHIEFIMWFCGALLLLAGVAGMSVKLFVVPAVEKAFALHGKDPDAHPGYLKQGDYTKRHDALMESVNAVGVAVAAISGQLRQDIRTDRKADAKAEGKS